MSGRSSTKARMQGAGTMSASCGPSPRRSRMVAHPGGHPKTYLGPRRSPRGLFVSAHLAYLAAIMLSRPRIPPAGFIAPCLPTKAERPPSGELWLHEIKHDGFRVIARKDGARVRLYSWPGRQFD